MCRCNERRKALAKALVATAQGDVGTIKTELKFVASSSVEDARSATRSLGAQVAQARMRLGARRR